MGRFPMLSHNKKETSGPSNTTTRARCSTLYETFYWRCRFCDRELTFHSQASYNLHLNKCHLDKAEPGYSTVIDTHKPYFGTIIVLYFPDEVDDGPIATIERHKDDPDFIFYVFYDSSVLPKPCPYHITIGFRSSSNVWKYANEGAVAYINVRCFNGGTSRENIYEGIKWQMHWQTVGMCQKSMPPNPNGLQWTIINKTIQSKMKLEIRMSNDDNLRAREVAESYHPLIPSEGFPNSNWIRYHFVQ